MQHLCTLDNDAATTSTSFEGRIPAATPGPMTMEGSGNGQLMSIMIQLQNTLRQVEGRLSSLERTVTPNTGTPSSETTFSPHSSRTIAASPNSLPHRSVENKAVADTALTIEYLALGRDRTKGIGAIEGQILTTPATRNILSQPRSEPLSKTIQSALLPRKSLEYLLVFAKDVVTWQHGCLHTPTFQRECEAFLSLQEREKWIWTDPLWLALFFVQQSIAVHQMHPGDVVELFGDRPAPAQALLTAATSCLDAGHYLAEPSLFTCQALAILCVSGHNVMNSNLLGSFLAIGLNTAKVLNLHKIGNESARVDALVAEAGGILQDDSPAWKRRIIDLEMGKRLWWSLVQQDYLGLPFRGVSAVNSRQHDTPLPLNVHDEDLERGELRSQYDEHNLTLVTKLRLTAKTAQIVAAFFEALPAHGATLEEHVAPYESRLLDLLPTSQPRSTNPSLKFGLALRRYVNSSVSHKILVAHRAFCSRHPSAEQVLRSQSRCVEVSRQILDQIRNINQSSRPEGSVSALWTVAYQAVAAASVIALTLFHSNSNQESMVTRDEVLGARDLLQQLALRSTIAERGVSLLNELIDNLDRQGQGSNRFTRRRSTATYLDEDGHSNGIRQGGGGVTKRARVEKESEKAAAEELEEEHGMFDFDWDGFPEIAGVLGSMPDVSKLFDGTMANPFG